MQIQGKDLDRVVEIISERVEAELKRRSTVGENVAPCGDCSISGSCNSSQVIGSINQGAKRVAAVGQIESAPCSHVAPLIDHTLLKPDATKEELAQVCEEARRFGFASVCVNSSNIGYTARALSGTLVKPIAVVGFPLGASTPSAKAFETKEAIRAGAKEIDMVLNIGALKSRDHAAVFADIRSVVEAAARYPVKVILETAKLTRDEKVMACALAKAAGAAFVKTSTGFGGGGATAEDVALMRSVVGEDVGVKASGGIRTIDDAERVIDAGATRIGASASVAIVHCKRATESGKSGY